MIKQPVVLERKGPHKSMHCKFCKPPESSPAHQQSQSHLEKRTKLRLAHQGADLQVYDVFSEPGIPAVESEACICQLEGEKICGKCLPDKNYIPRKKKKCTCPRGARPHPNTIDSSQAGKKKLKRKESDDEFWWEKYEREQAAIVAETWAAWMAQMKEDKKLAALRFRDSCKYLCKLSRPKWFHILSCVQVFHLEFLSQAIRLDLDENITDRTNFVLAGMGFYPRPKRRILKKCLKFCSYNAIDFLNQLQLLLKEEDQFNERTEKKDFKFPKCYQNLYSWNDRIIMTAVCYLEFPQILKEIMDRLQPLPRPSLLPQVPYPEIPKRPKMKYKSPYEEPVWHDRLNWLEKDKIDRMNRARLHMENKRVKIPHLALARRPSLIDARPAFLSQIEANERDYFGRNTPEKKKPMRFKAIETFDSNVDVTAIEGVEASEVSTIERADTDDICVFLRDQPKAELTDEEEINSESDDGISKSMIESEEGKIIRDVISVAKSISQRNESILGEEVEIPFRTPPKTSSGNTLVCPVPVNSRAPPPEINYEEARLQLAIINEEVCCFIPRIYRTTSCDIEEQDRKSDVSERLRKAAKKLRKYSTVAEEEPEPEEQVSKKSETSSKKRKKSKKRRCSKKEEKQDDKEMPSAEKIIDLEIKPEKELPSSDQAEIDDFKVPPFSVMDIRESVKGEEEELDSEREETVSEVTEHFKKRIEKKKRKKVKKIKKKRKSKSMDNTENGKQIIITLEEEMNDYKKQKPVKKNKVTMTESYPGEYDLIYNSDENKENIHEEPKEASIHTGRVNPLLKKIMKDLAEEGYVSAGYEQIIFHPDIQQLILHLKGEFLDKETREWLWLMTKKHWKTISGPDFYTPKPLRLNISSSRAQNATWAIKRTLQKDATNKKNLFYFELAKLRSQAARDLYATLYQKYLGVTPKFLNTYYAYMISRFQDCIVKGLSVDF